jgi:hypothetical protein
VIYAVRVQCVLTVIGDTTVPSGVRVSTHFHAILSTDIAAVLPDGVDAAVTNVSN